MFSLRSALRISKPRPVAKYREFYKTRKETLGTIGHCQLNELFGQSDHRPSKTPTEAKSSVSDVDGDQFAEFRSAIKP